MTPKREQGPKLGELLAARGKLDRAVLLQALRHQRAQGGRLGTCLLELDAVAEDDVLHVLSDQLKIPFVEADDLRQIPQDVLRLVPVKVAAARCAVPIRASGTQLSVAMLDPHDLTALDELAFVSGRRIRPQTALEVRIQEALGRAYGHDIPTRFTKLIDRLNRARYLWKEEAAAPDAQEPGPSPMPSPQSPYPEPPRRPEDARPQAAPRPAPPPLPPLPTPPPPPAQEVRRPDPKPPATVAAPTPLSFDQAAARLHAPESRDSVAQTVVDFLRTRSDVALLLMIRRNEAAGWLGAGLDEQAVSALRVPLDQPSVVHALLDGASLHRGPLSQLSGNAPLRVALGREITDLVALPLRVRDRAVGVVVAASHRRALPAELVDETRRIASLASNALALIVLRKKRR